MRDQFERNINYMRVSVTDRCNLRCVYCMPKDGVQQISHDEILTFDEIARVCRIGAELGISRIKLTGGEPLVRKGIEDLAEMICRIPGIEQVTLTTNGILLKDKLPALKKAGISDLVTGDVAGRRSEKRTCQRKADHLCRRQKGS